ncbi:hypothetical protein [Actinomadura decatromicini]|uniref:Uncharacterized protein n=1 Tax=Actinomadura decatromicini TaxID=2604572 RepID=A0A5D3F674_9ACTN|nr:hypothetical protein [Actinomadura decatromicini]TYK43821.1 hypothetical protein FXF68_37455 [Actinomadura decatromicini]
MSTEFPMEEGEPIGGENEELFEKLRELGFMVAPQGEAVIFSREGEQARVGPRTDYVLPLSEMEHLKEQLTGPVKPLQDYFGFMSPSNGWFEVTVTSQRRAGRSRLFDPILGRVGSDGVECRHRNGTPMLSVEPPGRYQGQPAVNAIHVSDVGTNVCIELSWASPCGILFGYPNGRLSNSAPPRFISSLSLKVDFGSTQAEAALLSQGMQLVDSIIFELNVRNRLAIEPLRRAEEEREFRRRRYEHTDSARFPQISLQREVSELFSFAESARDNPPLAFLSFYQVLEYFFPYAVRRNAMRKMRKEIADPFFSGSSDQAILRLLAVAESATNASEVTQISTLISDSVRSDRILDFLDDDERRSHFGKNGPISGVEAINAKNPHKTIAAQVSDRIYRIRNRIVHAKDDPKYADVRVLLPKSREAFALGPDIELIRLLAIEVIIDSQVG